VVTDPIIVDLSGNAAGGSTRNAGDGTNANTPADNTTATDAVSSNTTADGNSTQQGQAEVTPSSSISSCNYTQFAFCATGINLAFEGVDVNSRAFTSGAQVKKLNSFSLLALYNLGKEKFFDVKEMFTDKSQAYWGKFGAVQQDIQEAYSGNAEAGRTIGSTEAQT
jgi:hypothetical protein